MSPMRFIRTTVLGLKQVEMAAIAGVRQPTVSRWESGELEPSRAELVLIRAAAAERGLRWNDAWFFEPPSRPAPQPEKATSA